MNHIVDILAPLLLLFSGATVVDAPRDKSEEGEVSTIILESYQAPVQNQVRIEQRMTIRITPRGSAAPPPVVFDPPPGSLPPHFSERHMGSCLPISGIAGVQPGGKNRLLLFMRDHRIVSAELEKVCSARDFYSGFYIEPNTDGQLCIDRDKLQSRSGANCVLKRLRQLVETGD